jgi:small subunit ribosomal protein S20
LISGSLGPAAVPSDPGMIYQLTSTTLFVILSNHSPLGKRRNTVPQRKAGIKDLRKNHTRHMHNLDIKTDLKKTTKKFIASVKDKDSGKAQTDLNELYKKLDKATKRNLLHKNTVARRKSKFSKQLAGLAS